MQATSLFFLCLACNFIFSQKEDFGPQPEKYEGMKETFNFNCQPAGSARGVNEPAASPPTAQAPQVTLTPLQRVTDPGELLDLTLRLLRAPCAAGRWNKLHDLICKGFNRHLGLAVDERLLRDAISNSGGRILSCTSGYQLTDTATLADLQHATADLRSRSKTLDDRANSIEVRWLATHGTSTLTPTASTALSAADAGAADAVKEVGASLFDDAEDDFLAGPEIQDPRLYASRAGEKEKEGKTATGGEVRLSKKL